MLRSISGELLNLFGLRCDDFNKVMHDINTRVHVVPNKSIYTLFKEYLFQALSPEKVKKIKELKSKISIRKKRI